MRDTPSILRNPSRTQPIGATIVAAAASALLLLGSVHDGAHAGGGQPLQLAQGVLVQPDLEALEPPSVVEEQERRAEEAEREAERQREQREELIIEREQRAIREGEAEPRSRQEELERPTRRQQRLERGDRRQQELETPEGPGIKY